MAHTPGPWSLHECSNGGALLRRGSEKSWEHPQGSLQIVPIDDARLISLAPDMLAELRRLAEVFAWEADHPTVKLIAKAEGR